MPWSLTKISRKKLRKANQIMGLMSTPNAGGTITRVTCRKGSVGQAMMLAGSLFRSTWGYHDSTIRTKKANPPKSRMGSMIVLAGATHELAASSIAGPPFSMSSTLEGSTIILNFDADLVVQGCAAADLAGREEERCCVGIRKAWVEAARKDRRRATRTWDKGCGCMVAGLSLL
eukprot:evm.model.NODE_19488_length_45021_cov_26.593590.8